MLKFLVAFLLFFVVSRSANAISGCINASRSTIYTNFQSGTTWKSNQFSNASPCLYIYTGAPCTISGIGSGQLGDTANPRECPIDDYIWVMMILFGGVGFYIIRQKNMRLAVIS